MVYKIRGCTRNHCNREHPVLYCLLEICHSLYPAEFVVQTCSGFIVI
jgi:hypothetical protein